MASLDEASGVHATMLAAFEEYRRFPNPSSALHESVDDVRAIMERGGAALCEEKDMLVGCVRFVLEPKDHVKLSRLAVLPSHRGRGLGAELVAFVEAHARALGCTEARAEARSQQPDNRDWWVRLGYEIVGYDDVYGVPDLRTYLVKALTPAAG